MWPVLFAGVLLAVQRVRALARVRGLANVQAIQSDCRTGLPDDSIDVVLLYGTFCGWPNPSSGKYSLETRFLASQPGSLTSTHARDSLPATTEASVSLHGS
jgi:hypothetical protein